MMLNHTRVLMDPTYLIDPIKQFEEKVMATTPSLVDRSAVVKTEVEECVGVQDELTNREHESMLDGLGDLCEVCLSLAS